MKGSFIKLIIVIVIAIVIIIIIFNVITVNFRAKRGINLNILSETTHFEN
jgi:hypothetical protein